MYKILILIFFSSLIRADLVSFVHEGYTSYTGSELVTKKATSKRVGKYKIFSKYTLLARWKTEFLMGEPVLYADYIYSIDKISIHVDDISSVYNTMGIDSSDYSLSRKESNFFRSLVRIPSAKVRVIFHPEYDSAKEEMLIDGGVGAKHYGGKEFIYIDAYNRHGDKFQEKTKKAYWKIDSKYRSFNTKGSPKWENLFLHSENFLNAKKYNMKIVKYKGYFDASIEDVVLDYSNLILHVEKNILSKKPSKKKIKSSLMLLIDASGSMSGSRFSAAKSAAISNAKRAISKNVEVSVAFFGGECSDNNVLHVHDFTQDANSLESFIQNANIMGGTPLSLALKKANEYLYSHKSKSSKSETVLLLGDGEGSCGNIQSVIDNLKANNTFAHHETIGLEVGTSSNASSQLARIATQSGGNYHSSNSVADLDRVFEDASDIDELSDMVGSFGTVNNKPKGMSSNNGMQSILNGFE